MAPCDQLDALVAAVREMGGSGGNIKLREKLGWDEAAYDAVRDQAIAAGKVTLAAVAVVAAIAKWV